MSVSEKRATLDTSVAAYNALKGKEGVTAQELEDALAQAKEDCRICAAEMTAEAYKEFLADETPMIAALTARVFTTVAVKNETDEQGTVLGIKVEPKEVQINPLALETFYRSSVEGKGKTLGADKDWARNVQKFNLELGKRIARRLHFSVSEFARTFAISDAAAKVELTVTDSEESVGRSLQEVIDKIVYIPDGDKNKIQIDKYDRAYLLEGYTAKNRRALSIVLSNNGKLLALIADIIHSKLVQANYELVYRMKKQA